MNALGNQHQTMKSWTFNAGGGRREAGKWDKWDGQLSKNRWRALTILSLVRVP